MAAGVHNFTKGPGKNQQASEAVLGGGAHPRKEGAIGLHSALYGGTQPHRIMRSPGRGDLVLVHREEALRCDHSTDSWEGGYVDRDGDWPA